MSISNWAIFKLASILCITTAKVIFLLSNSVLRGLLFVLPNAREERTPDTNEVKQEDPELHYYNGETFTLEDIADILMMDCKEIGRRIRSGETLKNIIENPT